MDVDIFDLILYRRLTTEAQEAVNGDLTGFVTPFSCIILKAFHLVDYHWILLVGRVM